MIGNENVDIQFNVHDAFLEEHFHAQFQKIGKPNNLKNLWEEQENQKVHNRITKKLGKVVYV